MHRWLLALAGLLATACAATPNRETTGAAPARPGGTPAPVSGFEKQAGESVTAVDVTHDGKPDLWTYAVIGPGGTEILVRKEKDLNADGKVDTWEKYGPDGAVVRLAHDLDFDGRLDVTLLYEGGQLVRKELAFGFDGVPRTFSHYEKGRLVRKERDLNADGKVDYWEYWVDGEVDRIGVDDDGDGSADRWEVRRTAASVPEGGQK